MSTCRTSGGGPPEAAALARNSAKNASAKSRLLRSAMLRLGACVNLRWGRRKAALMQCNSGIGHERRCLEHQHKKKFLKVLGVTSQREIEKAVREAMAQGITGNERLSAKAVVTLERVGLSHKVDGGIELG